MAIPSVTLLLHQGSSREYAVTVPTAPHIYTSPPPPAPAPAPLLLPAPPPATSHHPTAVVPYNQYAQQQQPYTATAAAPLSKIKFKPAKGQPDSWTLRLPDAAGDGHHRWNYTHVHAARECDCYTCIYRREEKEREEKEWEDKEWELEMEERERERERERDRDREKALEWQQQGLEWELERERERELSRLEREREREINRLLHARRSQRRLRHYYA